MSRGAPGVRYGELDRETRETRVHVVIDLDGGQKQDLATGLEHFDRLLGLAAEHGRFNLGIEVESIHAVYDHHILEDVGVALGKVLRQSLADSAPIRRNGSAHGTRADALVLVAIEIAGRGRAYLDLDFADERIGDLASQNIAEFLDCLALYGGMTVHARRLAGSNDQHVCDALFKALGEALHLATRTQDR
jgi:imidazoleglycerol-phosphate dehydratase